VRVIAPGPHII